MYLAISSILSALFEVLRPVPSPVALGATYKVLGTSFVTRNYCKVSQFISVAVTF